MKIHEYQAKGLLARYGVPVPRGEVAHTIPEAEAAAVADAAAEAARLAEREATLVARRDEVRRRADYLRHVVAEIEAARLQPGERALMPTTQVVLHAGHHGRRRTDRRRRCNSTADAAWPGPGRWPAAWHDGPHDAAWGWP